MICILQCNIFFNQLIDVFCIIFCFNLIGKKLSGLWLSIYIWPIKDFKPSPIFFYNINTWMKINDNSYEDFCRSFNFCISLYSTRHFLNQLHEICYIINVKNDIPLEWKCFQWTTWSNVLSYNLFVKLPRTTIREQRL